MATDTYTGFDLLKVLLFGYILVAGFIDHAKAKPYTHHPLTIVGVTFLVIAVALYDPVAAFLMIVASIVVMVRVCLSVEKNRMLHETLHTMMNSRSATPPAKTGRVMNQSPQDMIAEGGHEIPLVTKSRPPTNKSLLPSKINPSTVPRLPELDLTPERVLLQTVPKEDLPSQEALARSQTNMWSRDNLRLFTDDLASLSKNGSYSTQGVSDKSKVWGMDAEASPYATVLP